MGDEVKDLLISQFDHVREWSLMSSGGLTEEQSVSIPRGGKNHILWELGHIVWSENYMITWGCAGGERLPEDWEAKFGYKSKVLPDATEYPQLEEMRNALETGLEQTKSYIGSLSLEGLLAPPRNFPRDNSVSSILTHFLLHEAYHVGKISLLRKMLGLQSTAELLIEK